VQELEDLLHNVQHVLLDDATACDAGSNQADAKLQQAGLSCPADAALSLAKHMQAAYAVQRLQLPAVKQQQPLHANNSSSIAGNVIQAGRQADNCLPEVKLGFHVAPCCKQSYICGLWCHERSRQWCRPENVSTSSCCMPYQHQIVAEGIRRGGAAAAACAAAADVDDDPDQLGSRHHLLGVSPQQLRAMHMPNKKAAQVRSRLACWLACLLACRSSSTAGEALGHGMLFAAAGGAGHSAQRWPVLLWISMCIRGKAQLQQPMLLTWMPVTYMPLRSHTRHVVLLMLPFAESACTGAAFAGATAGAAGTGGSGSSGGRSSW
jgi:hypothetical protein